MEDRSARPSAPRKIMIPQPPDTHWMEKDLESSTPIIMIAIGLVLLIMSPVINSIISMDIHFFFAWVFIGFTLSILSMILLIVGVFLEYDRSRKRKMIFGGETTSLPTIAVILLFVGAMIGILTFAIPIITPILEGHDVHFDLLWYLIFSVLGIMPIFAGILSWKRRRWLIAVILGSLGIIVGFIPVILGVILIVLSKWEFTD
jgi:hypothetical protein